MGGLLIILSVVISLILWSDFETFCMDWFFGLNFWFIGFSGDYDKIKSTQVMDLNQEQE